MIVKKTRWRYGMAAALMLVAGAAALGAAQTALSQDRQFQDAYQKEMVAGDLKSAIETYRGISTRAGVDRTLAATALLRMAECYDKLGDPSARGIYDEIVRTYADQPAATTARTRTSSPARQRMSLSRVYGPIRNSISAVSDDGRLLAHSDGSGELIVRDLRAGTEKQVTENPPDSLQYAQEATFSPDGRFLAYSWFNAAYRYDLRVADLASGTSRVLYENEEIPWLGAYDWSPDGQSIAIQMRLKDRTGQIALVSASTGAMRVLKSTDWRGSSGLFFSPDGKHLLFDLTTTAERGDRDVFVLAVDGSRQIAVTEREVGESAVGWMPDGKHVLFAREAGGQNALWARAFSNGRFDQAPVLVSADIGEPASLGITRSGTLFLTRLSGGSDILVGPVDLKNASSPFTPANATFVLGGNRNAEWSPDGRWLAYYSLRRAAGGSSTALFLRSLETGRSREVRPTGLRIRTLEWTPDSRALLVLGEDGRGRGGIYRVDVQTGEVEFIVAGQLPQASADGARIFFRRNNAAEQSVFELTLATREERELMRGTRGAWSRVSPDSQSILGFTADRTALIVAPLAGGPTRELLKLPAGERLSGADWTHDGRAIVFRKNLSAQESGSQFWLYELATGQTRKITAVAVPGAVGASLSPDNSQIAVQVLNAQGTELWSLENFSVPAENSAPAAGGR